MAASPSAPGPLGRGTGRPASIPMPARSSPAAASCRSAPARGSRSSPAATTPARRSTPAATSPWAAWHRRRAPGRSRSTIRTAGGSPRPCRGTASPAMRWCAPPTATTRSGRPASPPGNWLPPGGIERTCSRCGSTIRRSAPPLAAATYRSPGQDGRHVRSFGWRSRLLGGVLLGGIVHLATVLILPGSRYAGCLFAPIATDGQSIRSARFRCRHRRSRCCRSWIRRLRCRCAAMTSPMGR